VLKNVNSIAFGSAAGKPEKGLDIDDNVCYNLSNWLVNNSEEGFTMEKGDVPETKLRILRAAEKLFAEKGFDGARVDDIAEKAGVNKALIYYYFKSKRDILDELCTNLIEKFAKMGYSLIEDLLDIEAMEYREENMPQLTEMVYQFMEDKKDTIRIMMMESLKGSEKNPPLFKFADISMSEESEMLRKTFKDMGMNVDAIDADEQRIADFFTGFVPLISFLVYSDKWSKYFNIDEEELRRKFLAVFQITHMAYHKVQLEQMK
jgi:AcrR family transcriptional regulator